MQVFKAFFKIVKYNKMYMFMSLGITISLVIMLSHTNADSTKVVKESYTVIVDDKDNSEMSKELVKFIEKNHKIKKGNFTDDDITDNLFYQEISEYIEIPKGFGDEFTSNGKAEIIGKYDEARPNGLFINNQINEFLSLVGKKTESGISIKEACSSATKDLDKSEFVSIKKEHKGNEEKTKQVFGFMSYAMMLIIFSGCMKPIIAFNDDERRRRTDVSSIKTWKKTVAIASGCICLALFFFVVLVSFATIMVDRDEMFTKTWWLVVLNLLVYTVSVSMLLFAISTFIKKDGSATNMISNVFTLTFAFLGGTFVPLELLGDTIKTIGKFVPNYWYSTALYNIVDGGSVSKYLNALFIQVVFGIAALAVGLCSNKLRNDARIV